MFYLLTRSNAHAASVLCHRPENISLLVVSRQNQLLQVCLLSHIQQMKDIAGNLGCAPKDPSGRSSTFSDETFLTCPPDWWQRPSLTSRRSCFHWQVRRLRPCNCPCKSTPAPQQLRQHKTDLKVLHWRLEPDLKVDSLAEIPRRDQRVVQSSPRKASKIKVLVSRYCFVWTRNRLIQCIWRCTKMFIISQQSGKVMENLSLK